MVICLPEGTSSMSFDPIEALCLRRDELSSECFIRTAMGPSDT